MKAHITTGLLILGAAVLFPIGVLVAQYVLLASMLWSKDRNHISQWTLLVIGAVPFLGYFEILDQLLIEHGPRPTAAPVPPLKPEHPVVGTVAAYREKTVCRPTLNWFTHTDGSRVHDYHKDGHVWGRQTQMSQVCVLCDVPFQHVENPLTASCPIRVPVVH